MNLDDTTDTTAAMGNECRRLDAYFDADLGREERLEFEGHLSQCPKCGEAVEQQRWIDGVLQSSDAGEEEVLCDSARVVALQAISRSRRRTHIRRALIGATAAAVSIAILAVGRFNSAERFAAPGFARGSNNEAIVRNAPPRQSRGLQEASFVTDGSTIAVPLASDDAQVSIVQLYPTTTTERRWQRELSLSAGRAGQDGG